MGLKSIIGKIASAIRGKKEEPEVKEYKKPEIHIDENREIPETPEIRVSWDPTDEELKDLKNRIENTADEVTKQWQEAAETARRQMEEFKKSITAVGATAGEAAKVFSRELNFALGNIDQWQYEKAKWRTMREDARRFQ